MSCKLTPISNCLVLITLKAKLGQFQDLSWKHLFCSALLHLLLGMGSVTP